MKRKSQAVIVVLVILGAAGYFVCLALKHRPDITYSLDFGSIIDAFALILIGVLIEFAYSKKSSDHRADTDLLLGIVSDAKVALVDLQKQSEPCGSGKKLAKREQDSLTSAERELSNAVHSIEVGLHHCDVELVLVEFSKLSDARSALKDSLTDTPFPGPYDAATLRDARNKFKIMRDELTRIAFAINHR